jgi:hypothetical protein
MARRPALVKLALVPFVVAMAVGLALPAAAHAENPGTIVLPTPEAPVETTEPTPVPTPTETAEPVPTETPEPTPEPSPTEEPVPAEPGEVPTEVPVEPVPEEIPEDDGDEEFFDEGDDVVEEEVVPVAPPPPPVPSPTPIPAVDIFAPFYPPSSGAARDLMPVILGGSAAGLVLITAIVAFVISRWRLVRLRSSITGASRPAGPSGGPGSRRPLHETPAALDISSLLGARPREVRRHAETALRLTLPQRDPVVPAASGSERFAVPGIPAKRVPLVRSKSSLEGGLITLFGAARPADALGRTTTSIRTDLSTTLGLSAAKTDQPRLMLSWDAPPKPRSTDTDLRLEFAAGPKP